MGTETNYFDLVAIEDAGRRFAVNTNASNNMAIGELRAVILADELTGRAIRPKLVEENPFGLTCRRS